MAINATYYLDAADLGSAVSVYLDLSLSYIAPDGIYGDGVITREQSSGILLTSQPCATCGTPCGSSIGGSGGTGIYLINLDAGTTISDVGAIIVRFDPYGVPDGIRATYNSVVYNKLSSPIDGVHQSVTYGYFTVVGDLSSDCSLTGNTTVFPTLTEYLYSGTSFVATGNTQSITIFPGDVSLGAAPGNCVMVIPKTSPAPNVVSFEMIGPCGGTAWSITVNCPVLLPSIIGSDSSESELIPCGTPMTNTYYFVKVHSAVDSFVGLYDYVFTDAYGEFPLGNGYYLINNVAVPNKVILVLNGIVTAITNCY